MVAVEDFPILNHHQSQDTLPETNIDNIAPENRPPGSSEIPIGNRHF